MPRRKLAILVVLSAAVAAAGGTLAARWNSAPTEKPEVAKSQPLHIDAADLDFGTQWDTDRFAWTVRVRNSSTERVTIRRLSSSCSCTSLEPSQFELAPGGEQTIRLQIDLGAVKDRSGAVRILLNADAVPAPSIERSRGR